MSAFDSSGNAQDMSGHGHIVNYNGGPIYSYTGLAPYIAFDGDGDYLSRADEADLDITGTEAYVAAGKKGVTCGGWWYPQDAANTQSIIAKWTDWVNWSYLLFLDGAFAGDPVGFAMSDTGAALSIGYSTTGYSINTWQFFAGRFNDAAAGAEIAVWNNGEKTTTATARNSIFNSNSPLCIGSHTAAAAPYTGYASLVFLCASALSDAAVFSIYQQTRALFSK
jgi:hypothetical protein